MICPRCNNYAYRIKRKHADRLFNTITLGVFRMKRFKCFYCYWEGMITGRGKQLQWPKTAYRHE